VRKLSYALIAVGIILLCVPKLTEWHADREQQRLLRMAEQMIDDASHVNNAVVAEYERVSQIFELETDRIESEPLSGVPDTAVDQAELAAAPPPDAESGRGKKPEVKPVATIEIEKIALKLPVLAGATEENMKAAAAHMVETAQLGQTGNAAIAAHRARTKGRLFNRLDELQAGDEIVVRTAGESYVYTVYDVSIVEPTDVTVLSGNGEDKMLTLITCDPVVNATHRLIIHAKMA